MAKSKKKKLPPPTPPPPTPEPEPEPVPEPVPPNAQTEEERLNYFRQYNATHREILLERKRMRYQNDPEYKNKILTKAREHYQNHKNDPAKTSEHSRVCPMCHRPLPRIVKPLLMHVDGSSVGIRKQFEVYMYSIGELSDRLKRQSRTIKAWIRDGVIPEARYRNGVQRRLWTLDQVEMFEAVTAQYNLRPPANYKAIGFIDHIKKEWQKLMPLGIDMKKYTENNGGFYRRINVSEVTTEETDAA